MQNRSIPQMVEEGKKLKPGRTWDEVSIAMDILTEDYRPDPGLTYRIVEEGYIPKRTATCIRLGLPTSVTVIVIGDGVVPPGSQTINAKQCGCGRWFISNHPLRTYCFICHPFGGGKHNGT
jgi:hypothetical protein